MKNKTKLNIELALAVLMTLFGVVLIAVSFWVPPTGVIDPTVLTAYGETLTFVGALVGVDYHYRHPSPGKPDPPLKEWRDGEGGGDTSPGLRPPPSQRDGGRENENEN